jgi:hypothetical protein
MLVEEAASPSSPTYNSLLIHESYFDRGRRKRKGFAAFLFLPSQSK